MRTLSYKDERIKLGLFLIIGFIIQGLLFYVFSQVILSKVNEAYINQNTAIIGSLATYDQSLAEKVIPIMTGKEAGDIQLGRELLSPYSYHEGLSYQFNPLFDRVNQITWYSIGLMCLICLIILVGSESIINPVFRELKYLTVRAQDIIENKKRSKVTWRGYRGSLEKFIDHFILMEDRVKNSLDLLQDEKINLKNIINDISHQLKTPLMALSMYNDILQDHHEMEAIDIDEFIQLSNEQLQRMDWLVKTLLKYARLESNVVEYHKEVTILNQTIQESMEMLRVKAIEKNQELTFHAKKEIPFYHDSRWIGEALSNIIKNAIEHTQEFGDINVILDETPLSIVVTVEDNGEGIKPSELKKIFNRFHKGENALNPTSIGIGLCLSKSIIQAHDGDITVESELGKGSKFYLTFLKTVH